ncbi:hypothetical protein CAPTEDRAFT_130691 [Capitella teleta]|uniref:Cytochrome P450 n=1 Tax=Capitella teleta TaxID=283909 RepID=R7TXA7_CAPTE|nr:hypothetical protein CAPTEDRAFT_130691 [Capitella teleta]|eukprot:ELT98568.1 hypothetical protein CAPTEDRAFT_130691 [Capitella teleta]
MTYAFLGPLPTVAMVHPETAKEILKTAEPKPTNLGAVYNFIFPWLGEGLLVAGGKRWARNRKLLTPAFHFDILKPYVAVNNLCTDVFLGKLDEMNDRYFEVFNEISLLTFDVILKCAFSYDIDCQKQGHPYVKAVSELGAALPERVLNPLLYPYMFFILTPMGRKFRRNCNYVHRVADDIIRSRRKALKENLSKTGDRYLDFLDILLTAKDPTGKGLTDKEIRQEVDTFMFEGHDTTASSISWALYSLASNPDCMQKCQEEVDRVLQGRDDDNILWNDLSELKYLNLCIKESLRMHTTVPFIQRITTKDCYVDGFLIPKHTSISLPLYTILHHPDVWKKPMEFIPERFSSENTDKMGSHAFVPFSAGPRNCIGQNFAMHEMKVILARVIRRFVFFSASK